MDISIWGHILIVALVAWRAHGVHELSRGGDTWSSAVLTISTAADIAVMIGGNILSWSVVQIIRVGILVAAPSPADRQIFNRLSPDASRWLIVFAVVLSGLMFALFQWIR